MRQESKYVITMRDGTIGWFHPFNENEPRRPLPPPPSPMPRPDFNAMLRTWSAATNGELVTLAGVLGVASWALHELGACWSPSHHAWAFPMCDARGDVIGIRLRYDDGQKRAVLGSHNGLFIPEVEPERRVYVCEGPTDTAAVLSMGLWSIGRPNASACATMLVDFIKRHRVREAVLLADNDTPGIRGAQALALPCPCAVLLTPAKDMREFLRLGGTRDLIESAARETIWIQP
jgi:5S rRNA maturation endonuclease (ribonuclease M5)